MRLYSLGTKYSALPLVCLRGSTFNLIYSGERGLARSARASLGAPGDSVAYIYSIRVILKNFYIIPFAASFSPMAAAKAEFWNVSFAQA